MLRSVYVRTGRVWGRCGAVANNCQAAVNAAHMLTVRMQPSKRGSLSCCCCSSTTFITHTDAHMHIHTPPIRLQIELTYNKELVCMEQQHDLVAVGSMGHVTLIDPRRCVPAGQLAAQLAVMLLCGCVAAAGACCPGLRVSRQVSSRETAAWGCEAGQRARYFGSVSGNVAQHVDS